MRIAVVGSGIAGLATAWLLSEQHQVTLFEANDYAGGHTHTVDVTLQGQHCGVDTGFLVFNAATYPNLVPMLRHLGVPVAPSEMTFSLALESPAIEWSGSNLDTLFAQRRNLLRPSFLRMLRDVLRFNREAAHFATEPAIATCDAPLSLGQFLSQGRYSDEFRDWYLGPMAAAIWSCPTRAMLDFPFASFAQFFRNHGLLQITDRPQWFTVPGGARQYVERLIAALQARGSRLRLNTAVRRVERKLRHGVQHSVQQAVQQPAQPPIRLHCDHGAEEFDALVLACHSDQSLALLGEQASAEERTVLSGIPYQANRALLHTDSSLLPARQKLWSAWNYSAGRDGPDGRPVAVHYLLNKLQPLPFTQPLLVSLNPHREPHPDSVLGEYDYAHPVFGANAAQAQAQLPSLQGQHHTWFCGAWTRYGFHEDGLRSAVMVARDFGIQPPWSAAVPAQAGHA